MELFVRAARVSGPSASSDLNALKLMPYVDFKPGWQKGRVGHSEGPPSVNWSPIVARSESLVAWYLSALALVIANAFWSLAGDGVRATMLSGERWVLSLVWFALGSPEASPALLL